MRIQVNVLDAALQHDVERVLFLGSSCIYPKLAAQPIVEDSLLTGPGTDQRRLRDRQDRRDHAGAGRSPSVRPAVDLGDADQPLRSERQLLTDRLARLAGVDPTLRRGCPLGCESVTNWGTGTPRREFLHADDMADACLHLLEHYDGPGQVNVGTGTDLTIREIAETIAHVVGYGGRTEWDATKPDGTPQKLLDVSKLAEAGWTSKIGLQDGLERTVAWYREHVGGLRG